MSASDSTLLNELLIRTGRAASCRPHLSAVRPAQNWGVRLRHSKASADTVVLVLVHPLHRDHLQSLPPPALLDVSTLWRSEPW